MSRRRPQAATGVGLHARGRQVTRRQKERARQRRAAQIGRTHRAREGGGTAEPAAQGTKLFFYSRCRYLQQPVITYRVLGLGLALARIPGLAPGPSEGHRRQADARRGP